MVKRDEILFPDTQKESQIMNLRSDNGYKSYNYASDLLLCGVFCCLAYEGLLNISTQKHIISFISLTVTPGLIVSAQT